MNIYKIPDVPVADLSGPPTATYGPMSLHSVCENGAFRHLVVHEPTGSVGEFFFDGQSKPSEQDFQLWVDMGMPSTNMLHAERPWSRYDLNLTGAFMTSTRKNGIEWAATVSVGPEKGPLSWFGWAILIATCIALIITLTPR